MSGKVRGIGVRSKEGSMSSGKKTRTGFRNKGGETGFMTIGSGLGSRKR